MNEPANQNTDDLEYSPHEILRARRIVLDSVPTEWMDFLDWQYRSEHLVEHPHQSYDLAWGLVQEGLVQIVNRPYSAQVMLPSIRRVPDGFDMSGIRRRFETRTLTTDDRRAIRDEAERDITDAHLMMVHQDIPGQSKWREMQRRIKRTRRAHVCTRSGVPIPPGERHLRLSYGIGHEQMLTQRVCLSVAWCEANDLRERLSPGIYIYPGLETDLLPSGQRSRNLPWVHGQAMPPDRRRTEVDRPTFITRIEALGFEVDAAANYWFGSETGLRLDADGGVVLLNPNGVPVGGRLRYDDALDLVQTGIISSSRLMRFYWKSVVFDRNTRQPGHPPRSR